MRILPVIQDNQQPSLCGPCGGKCCKHRPGYSVPADHGATELEMVASIATKLASGLWAIDWWEGDLEGADSPLFIRPAEEQRAHRMRHAGWGDRCVLLTVSGCSLAFVERPVMCRALEPLPGEKCKQPWTNEQAVREWIPYQHVVLEAERLALAAIASEQAA